VETGSERGITMNCPMCGREMELKTEWRCGYRYWSCKDITHYDHTFGEEIDYSGEVAISCDTPELYVFKGEIHGVDE